MSAGTIGLGGIRWVDVVPVVNGDAPFDPVIMWCSVNHLMFLWWNITPLIKWLALTANAQPVPHFDLPICLLGRSLSRGYCTCPSCKWYLLFYSGWVNFFRKSGACNQWRCSLWCITMWCCMSHLIFLWSHKMSLIDWHHAQSARYCSATMGYYHSQRLSFRIQQCKMESFWFPSLLGKHRNNSLSRVSYQKTILMSITTRT